jgi:hypothetical protein
MIRRRLYVEVRVSRLATWSRRIAIFAIPVVLLAIGMHRLSLVEYNVAVAALVAGYAVAGIALLIAIWNEGLRGLGRAFTAAAIGLLIVGWPLVTVARSATLPTISDITTDVNDPPQFVAVAQARPRGANPVRYPGAANARLQHAA